MSKRDIYCAPTFESFTSIFEDSNLSQMKLPKSMISSIHNKEEHINDKYSLMGHMYRSKVALPMPHKYFIPPTGITIPEPLELKGRKSSRSPFQDKEVKSEYTDFAWYLQSLPFGEHRIFIVNPELEFFMLIYHKLQSVGSTGEQYAIMAWDRHEKEYIIEKTGMTLEDISKLINVPTTHILRANKGVSISNKPIKEDTPLNKGQIITLPPRAIDYGYGELTTAGVDRLLVRSVHDSKGGNTNMKVQEFVREMTRHGGKGYAPSLTKKLYVYNLGRPNPSQEPRVTREAREAAKGEAISTEFLRVFASRFARIVASARPEIKEKLLRVIDNERSSNVKDPEFDELATALGSDAGRTQYWLYTSFAKFRQELFDEGRVRVKGAPSAYTKTSGFELQKENQESSQRGFFLSPYRVMTKRYSPDEEGFTPATGEREAQKEQYKRELPVAGEYASIPSIISKHTLDGAIDKFAAYLVTGKIKEADISVAGIHGVTMDDTEDQFKRTSSAGKKTSGNWLF